MSEPTPHLLRRALDGENLTLDGDRHTLHDLTQVALAMRSEATLAIVHGSHMTPLEQASVATVGKGRVTFV